MGAYIFGRETGAWTNLDTSYGQNTKKILSMLQQYIKRCFTHPGDATVSCLCSIYRKYWKFFARTTEEIFLTVSTLPAQYLCSTISIPAKHQSLLDSRAMPPKNSSRKAYPTIGRATSEALSQISSSPVHDASDRDSTDELTLGVDTAMIRKTVISIEDDTYSDEADDFEHDDDVEATQQIIEELNAEAIAEQRAANFDNALSEGLDDTHINVLSEDSRPSYLQVCQQMQDEMFPSQTHLKKLMGVWELDILHREHECYNIHLFTDLRPSKLYERRYPTLVYGYGTVRVRTLCDKASTVWRWLTLENVKYVCAPQVTNHRLGLGALPIAAHYHLPVPWGMGTETSDNVGDGFLSISSGVGCALGRLDQGGRKVWALRTYDETVEDMPGDKKEDTEHDEQEESVRRRWFGWGEGRTGGGIVTGKRGREENEEVSPSLDLPTRMLD